MRVVIFRTVSLIFWGGLIPLSSEKPALRLQLYETTSPRTWSVPGIEPNERLGRYFDRFPCDRTIYDTVPWGRCRYTIEDPCFELMEGIREPEPDSGHPSVNIPSEKSANQQKHLEELANDPQGKEIVVDNNMSHFIEDYIKTASEPHRAHKRIVLLQKTIKWLLELPIPEENAFTWVDVFMLHYFPRLDDRSRSISLDERAHALYGLYSLQNKFNEEQKEHIVQYLEKAIALFEKDFYMSPAMMDQVSEPLLKEMFSLGEYATFEKHMGYEPAFNEIRESINGRWVVQIKEEIKKLSNLARFDTPGVSAQTKTAAIVFLYHISGMNHRWIKNSRIPNEARKILFDLTETHVKRNGVTELALTTHDYGLAMICLQKLNPGNVEQSA